MIKKPRKRGGYSPARGLQNTNPQWVVAPVEKKTFCLNQSFKILNTVLILSVGFEWDSKTLVSSANKIGTDLSFTNLGKSFINMRRSKGPKTGPWGTPCLIVAPVNVAILPFSLHSNVL